MLVLILLVVTGFAAFLGHGVEAVVIPVSVLFAVVLGFVQEYRAERAVAALREFAALAATVLRGGNELYIPANELVPGDWEPALLAAIISLPVLHASFGTFGLRLGQLAARLWGGLADVARRRGGEARDAPCLEVCADRTIAIGSGKETALTHAAPQRSLVSTARPFALLSVGAALLTITLKTTAYWLTGSVGLLSDAVESLVNLAAALIAVWALTVAQRPPDAEHTYGQSKAEYIASAVEGALILVAALSIALSAWGRLLEPRPLAQVWLGLTISLAAAAINGGVAFVLLRAGHRLRSITLVADAHHLLTDVWTSGGVVLAIVLVQFTGWLVLDSLIALLVAANIVWTGIRLLRASGDGLLDRALPAADHARIAAVLEHYQDAGTIFHALRTRAAGQRRFVSLHILVPGSWTIQSGHELAERIERDISTALPGTTVFTHLEPLEDPASWEDQTLDRAPRARAGSSAQPTAGRDGTRLDDTPN